MIDDSHRARARDAAHRLMREAEIWQLERAMQDNPEDPGTDPCDSCNRYIMPGDFYVLSEEQGLVCGRCWDPKAETGVRQYVISRMRVRNPEDYNPEDYLEEPPF